MRKLLTKQAKTIPLVLACTASLTVPLAIIAGQDATELTIHEVACKEENAVTPEIQAAATAASTPSFQHPDYLFDLNADGITDVFDNYHIYISDGDGYIYHNITDETYPYIDNSYFYWDKVWLHTPDILVAKISKDYYDTSARTIFTLSKSDFRLIDIRTFSGDVFTVDADNDGQTEFINPKTEEIIKIDNDGKFVSYPLSVYQPTVEEDEEESDTPTFVAWDYSMLGASMAQMFGRDGSGSSSSLAGGNFKNYDLNGDGLTDFINSNNGQTYLNIGNGSYYPQSFSGKTFFGDFNGDGISDFLISENLALTCYLTDPEGGDATQKTILSGFTVKGIWSKDTDKDGDIDLILIVTGTNQCYGVVMENNGKGTFKRHEYSLPGFRSDTYGFGKTFDLLDWDNDGNYELISAEKSSDNSYNINSYKITGTEISTQAELVCNIGSLSDFSLFPNPSSGQVILDCTGKTLSDNINERPVPPATAPSVVYEAKTGLVKIAWEAGSDTETPTSDLTYSVRIGTTPGGDDIVSPQASSDGTRLTIEEGNAGQIRQRIYDTSGWPSGKLYVSVQTVDGNCRGSAFSPETSFEKNAPANEFTMEHCDNFAIGDTLTLRLYCLSGTPEWNVDDARIVENEGRICKAVFDKGGEKNISVQVTDAAGNMSSPKVKSLSVLSANVSEGVILGDEDNRGIGNIHAWAMFDMDEDGTDEMYSSYYMAGSFLQGDKSGIYRRIPKMFNSHEYASKFFDNSGAGTGTFDVNRDGMCDIVKGHYIGYNLGDLDMDFEYADQGGEDLWIDFDNDGLYDAATGWTPASKSSPHSGNTTIKIRRNDGDYKTFNSNSISFSNATFGDFNLDGLTDIASVSGQDIILWHNNGDFTVSEGSRIEKPSDLTYIMAVEDFDHDGTFDIVYNKYVRYGDHTVLLLGNGTRFEFDTRAVRWFDINNDGIKEFITNEYTYYISKGDIKKEPSDLRLFVNGLGGGPVDSFVLSDNTRRLLHWGHDSYWSCDRALPADFNVTNERPLPPANIRHTQSDKYVVVTWDHSADKETPADGMRYNVSIKHKDAEGEGAYLFSPANSGKNGVRVPLHKPLLTTNCLTIPIANIPAGDYEVKVQGVDMMHDQSDFSETYEMHIAESAYVDAPATGEVNVLVKVRILNNSTTDIDWDGGSVQYVTSGIYELIWNTPGLKTITVNGQASKIMINPAPDGSFTMPAKPRVGDRITVKGNLMNEGRWVVIEKKFVGGAVGTGAIYEDVEIPLTSENKYAEIEIADAETAYITIKQNGETTIHHKVSSNFSTRDYTQTVTAPYDNNIAGVSDIAETVSNPSIDFVTADGATGKYKIQWSNPDKIRPEATGINVYRESAVADRFDLIATLPLDATEMTDNASTPDIVASRYVLAYELSFGRSRYSKPHQPVHVMINRGAGSSWNLIWGSYEGGTIPQYRILRGNSPENLQSIAEVSGHMTSYTDFSAPAGGELYYAVESVLSPAASQAPARTKSARSADNAPRSNVVAAAGSNIIPAESLKVISADGNTTIDGSQPVVAKIQLMAFISPTNATFTRASWVVIDGADIANVDNLGRVTATGNGAGTATVRAMTVDGSGLYADITITITGYSGIQTVDDNDGNTSRLRVYPSPAINDITVSNLTGNETDVYIFSLGGKIAYRSTTDDNQINIDCSSWAAGVYVVKTVDKANGTSRAAKFIKQ